MSKVTIKFKKDGKFSPCGMKTNKYSKGDEIEVSEAAAACAVNANLAAVVEAPAPKKESPSKETKSAGAAPENKSEGKSSKKK